MASVTRGLCIAALFCGICSAQTAEFIDPAAGDWRIAKVRGVVDRNNNVWDVTAWHGMSYESIPEAPGGYDIWWPLANAINEMLVAVPPDAITTKSIWFPHGNWSDEWPDGVYFNVWFVNRTQQTDTLAYGLGQFDTDVN